MKLSSIVLRISMSRDSMIKLVPIQTIDISRVLQILMKEIASCRLTEYIEVSWSKRVSMNVTGRYIGSPSDLYFSGCRQGDNLRKRCGRSMSFRSMKPKILAEAQQLKEIWQRHRC